MRDLLLLAAVWLSVYRFTRLVAVDRIVQAPREWLQVRLEQRWERKHPDLLIDDDGSQWQSMTAYLLGCMWCASVWVGGLVTLAAAMFIAGPLPVPWWLVWASSSAVTGWLASNERD